MLIVIIVSFSSCVKKAKESVQNGNFTIEYLFTQDGCKVYRFTDGSRYIYWVNCAGKIDSDYTTSTGKSRITHHEETIISK